MFKNYFTSSLNFLPAEKAGTVLAAILISLPVCGFLPVLAALFGINLASLAGFMGWALPLTLNKMIKKDVDNYVKNNTTSQSNNNYSMKAFLEKSKNTNMLQFKLVPTQLFNT